MSYYCTESDVLNATGLDTDRIIELSDRHSSASQVTTLIDGFIYDAQEQIKEELEINYVIQKEKHLGTGEDDVFTLGGYDDESIYYDPSNCLVDVLNVYMGGFGEECRRLRPYPTNCELGTEVSWVRT